MNLAYFIINITAPLSASLIISLASLLVVGEEYRTWTNSAALIFIPGLFSMFFGDLMFVITYLAQSGTLTGIRNASGSAAFVHDLFNTYADLVSVPVTMLLAAITAKQISSRGKKVPKSWIKTVFWISLINAFVATFVMDPLGF